MGRRRTIVKARGGLTIISHELLAVLAVGREVAKAEERVAHPLVLPDQLRALPRVERRDGRTQEAALDVLSKLAPGHGALAWYGEAVVERVRAHGANVSIPFDNAGGGGDLFDSLLDI